MKIGQKLVFGYLAVATLVGFVGYIGINSGNRVGETFEVAKEAEIPALIETLEMKAAARQASIKAIEYSLRGEERDKKKTIEALGKLGTHLDAFEKAEGREVDRERQLEHAVAIQDVSDKITFYKIRVNEYVALKDQGASLKELFAKEQELHKARRELIHILYQNTRREQEELAQALARTKSNITNGVMIISIFSLASVFLAILIGLFISRSISKPIKELGNAAGEIGKGNLDTKIDIRSSDEIGQLANSFNKMAGDLAIYQKHLEELVEGRTVQLRTANEQLQQEINERKRMEEALRETSGQLTALIEAIPDAIYFKDAQGRHLVVNKACEELMGLGKEEILGKTNEELLPPNFGEQCRRSDEEAIKRREPVRFEEQATDDKGEKIFFETIVVPLLDERGNLKGLVGNS